MKGGHGPTKELQDLNWGAWDMHYHIHVHVHTVQPQPLCCYVHVHVHVHVHTYRAVHVHVCDVQVRVVSILCLYYIHVIDIFTGWSPDDKLPERFSPDEKFPLLVVGDGIEWWPFCCADGEEGGCTASLLGFDDAPAVPGGFVWLGRRL